jgi:hypothetical protein
MMSVHDITRRAMCGTRIAYLGRWNLYLHRDAIKFRHEIIALLP